MTIKKRLFWSNIFMIAVPVTSTVLIGCVCVGLIWLSLIGGMGLGIQDQEDFDHACMAISEMLEYDIDRDAGFSFVKPLLDSNRMALKIVAEGETLFEYGTKEDGDGKTGRYRQDTRTRSGGGQTAGGDRAGRHPPEYGDAPRVCGRAGSETEK